MDKKDEGMTQTFFEHLMELKTRVLRSVVLVLLVFIGLFPFANEVYTFVAQPIIDALPEEGSLISVGVVSPFLTPVKMALIFAVYISMPYIIYQLWMFIAPGLYRHERKFAIPLIISTGVLFYSGVLFSFYVVFPVIFGFLTSIGPSVVNFTPDIQYYLDFVLKVSFAFGVAFEVPIATIILIKFNIATIDGLKKNRSYVIIAAFIVGMILTPPDIISQTMIAVPMWILFEVGLFVAPYLVNIKKDEKNQEYSEYDDDVSDVNDSDIDESDEWSDDEWKKEFSNIDDDFEKLESEIDEWDGKK